MSELSIIIDKDIPFIKGVFEPYANVEYLKGNEFTNETVKNADALIIRTRTKCNEALLGGSSVKFIATATIGTDHIDLDYCRKASIEVTNAAGCNAGGVMQYVFTALYYLSEKKGFELPCCNALSGNNDSRILGDYKNTIGVIGVGNVGKKVAELAEYLGFEVLRCDPLKEREQTLAFNAGQMRINEFKDYYSLDYLLKNSDIVTMHTWLDSTTHNMADTGFFSKMKDGAVFINASRGEVVDDDALLDNVGRFCAVVLDVWNGEPQINRKLLQVADIATPHIAGYSYEGKVNGTTMAVRGVARHFHIEPLTGFVADMDSLNKNACRENCIDFCSLNKKQVSEQLTDIFPIFELDSDLRNNPEKFEKIRSNYNYRREFYVNPTAKTANLG